MKSVFAFLATTTGLLVAQGPLTPPGAPAPTMKTLSQVEPRIDVATLAGNANFQHRITSTGSYYLSGSISFGGNGGIEIAAANVTLDLAGFTVSGPGSGDVIFVGSSGTNATIRNGTVANGKNGVSCASGSKSIRLIGVRANACSSNGLQVRDGGLIDGCEAVACGTGIRADGSGAIIRNSISTGCTALGIRANPACQVLECSVNGSGGNGLEILQGSIATGNHISGSAASGIQISGSHCRVSGNTLQSNAFGVRTVSSLTASCVIEDNIVFGSSGSPTNGGTSDYDLNFALQSLKAIDVLLLPGDANSKHVIDKPGNYILSGNITTNLANGISINASNIHLDLCGHAVTGTGSGGAAIEVMDGGHSGVSVSNGSLQGFTNSVFLASAQGGRFSRLACISPLGLGIRLTDDSFSCRGNAFEDISITGSGNSAIQLNATEGTDVSANSFSRIRITAPTGRGIMINPSDGTCGSNRFSQITIDSPMSYGVQTVENANSSASSNVFEDVAVQGGATAAFSINSDHNRLTRCSADSPGGAGYWLQSLAAGNVLADCSVRASGGAGFLDQYSGETTYLRCTTHAAGADGFLIYGGGETSATRILDCLVHGSTGYGIRCGFEESTFSGVAIERCNISATGSSGILLTDAGDGSGLNNRVIDCMVTGATGTGISLAASAIAERNQVHQTVLVGGSGSDFVLADGDIHFSRNHSFSFSTVTAFNISGSAGGSYGPIITTGISGTGALLDTGPESHPAANFEH